MTNVLCDEKAACSPSKKGLTPIATKLHVHAPIKFERRSFVSDVKARKTPNVSPRNVVTPRGAKTARIVRSPRPPKSPRHCYSAVVLGNHGKGSQNFYGIDIFSFNPSWTVIICNTYMHYSGSGSYIFFTHIWYTRPRGVYIDGLVQERRNSSAFALTHRYVILLMCAVFI